MSKGLNVVTKRTHRHRGKTSLEAESINNHLSCKDEEWPEGHDIWSRMSKKLKVGDELSEALGSNEMDRKTITNFALTELRNL